MPLLTKRYTFWMIALFLGTSLSGCSLLPKEEAALAPPLVKPVLESYRTVNVIKGTITNEISVSASFESTSTEVAQFMGTGGRVEKIMVSPGDKVKKGDVLVQLIMNDLDLQIKEQELAIERAKLALQQIPKSNSAQEQSQEERANIAQSRKVASLQVEVEQLKYDRLVKQYKSKQLTSNIDGQVVFVEDINPGDNVDTYQRLVIIADPKKLQISTIVNSADQLNKVEVGFPAEISVNVNQEEKKFIGKVVQTPSSAPQTIDPALLEKYSNTLYIETGEMPKGIEIGQRADVKLITQQKKDVLIIPRSGLRSYMGRNFVRVLEDENKLREIDVETGIITSTEIEILKGLSEDDVVVLP